MMPEHGYLDQVGRWEGPRLKWPERKSTGLRHRPEPLLSPQGSSGYSCWLEVLIMVREVSPVLLIDELAGLLHVLGHARGTTAKYSNLSHLLEEEEPKENTVTARAGSVFKTIASQVHAPGAG